MKKKLTRIFIVEDEAIIVLDLRDRLSDLGYIVCGSAARGEAALVEIPSSRPDIVLMDIRLAGKLNGIETAARLHETSDVPVVFLTAHAESALLRQAGEVEPFGFLVKPFEERELHATIQMALYKHRMERRLLEANAQLEEKVKERTVALTVANRLLKESEKFVVATLDSLSEHICVIDKHGTILSTNRAWREFAENNSPVRSQVLEGANYLAVCDACTPEDAADVAAFSNGIREMIDGKRSGFSMEYACHSPLEQRWFVARVTRLMGEGPIRIVVAHETITERKLIEGKLEQSNKALRLSDARRREAQRLAKLGHWELDLASGALEWCDQAYEIFGRDPATYFPNIATYYAEIVHPDDVATVQREEKLAYSSGQQHRIDHRFRHADGSMRWVHIEGIAVCDAAGLVKTLHGTVQDITERKRAEEQYRAILQSAIDGFLMVDDTGNVHEVNDAYCRISGYSREELSRMRITDLEVSDEQEGATMRLRRIREQGSARYESRHRHKDGNFIDVEVSVQYSPAHYSMIVMFVQDISKRKRADEQRLALEMQLRDAQKRESDALLASIIGSALDAIITVDETQHILVFNHAAEMMFRCAATDAIGQHLNRFIPERFRAAHSKHMARFRQTGTTGRAMGETATVRALRVDGEEFPVEASISHVELQGRHLYSVVLRDITIRLATEDARRELEAQLRESQKMEAMGTLAGGIAHDFNNILAAILGNAAIAMKDVGPENRALVSLGEISKAGRRGRNLVQQILTFGRRQPQEMVTQPLRPLVEESLGLMRATLPAMVKLEGKLMDKALYVHADATQIGQVLMNLCTNAWHALHGDSGCIVVGLESMRIDEIAAGRIGGLSSGEYARLTVSDNGCGMDEATQARIFEPFYTTKSVGKGTGLGLPVVHGIVKAHRGAIIVKSAPGKGTTVEVLLPLVEAYIESTQSVSAEAAPARGLDRHVLYVDDDEAMVFMVTRILEDLGYRVSGYESAEAALATLRAHPYDYDLIVTDFNMPGVSGLDMARVVARINPRLPVVITSGYITDELLAGAKAAGVRHVVYKPDTFDELCGIVQRLLDENDA